MPQGVRDLFGTIRVPTQTHIIYSFAPNYADMHTHSHIINNLGNKNAGGHNATR